MSTYPDPMTLTREQCTDAMEWAKSFCGVAAERGVDLGEDPEGWMVGWFANAMMAMHDGADFR